MTFSRRSPVGLVLLRRSLGAPSYSYPIWKLVIPISLELSLLVANLFDASMERSESQGVLGALAILPFPSHSI
jgi:hypothetical protein